MKNRMPGVIAAAALALACTTPLVAQTPWNRKAEAIAVTTDRGTSLSKILAFYSLSGGDTPTAPIDYATDLLIRVNGAIVNEQRLPLTVGPNDGTSGCAGMGCLTNQACLCCNVGGERVCFCGGWIAAAEPVVMMLSEDDVIDVILRAAPGAEPERDPTDDSVSQRFEDRPMAWDRRLHSFGLTPTPGSPGSWDISYEADYRTSYDGPLNLAAEMEVVVNGAAGGVFPTGFPDSLTNTVCEAGCPPFCSVWGGCIFEQVTLSCWCYVPVEGTIRDFAARPGDVIELVLRAAPGALPELAEFANREIAGCLGDLDGDGRIGFGDILAVLGAWGPCAGCPQDLNGNGFVDFADLLLILGAWGPCVM